MQKYSPVWWLWECWGAGGSSLLSWAGSRAGIDSMAGMSQTLLTYNLHREQIHWKRPQGVTKIPKSLGSQRLNNFFIFLNIYIFIFIFLKWLLRNCQYRSVKDKKTIGKNWLAHPYIQPSGNKHAIHVSVQYLLKDTSSGGNQAGSSNSWQRLLAAVRVSEKKRMKSEKLTSNNFRCIVLITKYYNSSHWH